MSGLGAGASADCLPGWRRGRHSDLRGSLHRFWTVPVGRGGSFRWAPLMAPGGTSALPTGMADCHATVTHNEAHPSGYGAAGAMAANETEAKPSWKLPGSFHKNLPEQYLANSTASCTDNQSFQRSDDAKCHAAVSALLPFDVEQRPRQHVVADGRQRELPSESPSISGRPLGEGQERRSLEAAGGDEMRGLEEMLSEPFKAQRPSHTERQPGLVSPRCPRCTQAQFQPTADVAGGQGNNGNSLVINDTNPITAHE